MEHTVRIGYIGLGARGLHCLLGQLFPMTKKDVAVTAVCDVRESALEKARDEIAKLTASEIFTTTDYRELIAREDVDAVVVMTDWYSHFEIAVAAMKAGKHVGLEVGGTFSIDDCWRLVRTSEETGKSCMLLENCCYGRRELMVLNMARQGLFGDIVHCAGGYRHDLRAMLTDGYQNDHFRTLHLLSRNCDQYPTHDIGPIAKVLNINNKNRMLRLSSFSSPAKGLNRYAQDKYGPEHPVARLNFKQGDVVTTVITCSEGQTIVLSFDITLPRLYSRDFTVIGSKGMYSENNDAVFLDGQPESDPKSYWNNAESYQEQYDHPIWQAFRENVVGGHGGMDWLVFRAFVESVKNGTRPPIDVYDAAVYLSIIPLSEDSLALGGMPVAIPDFTNGKWINRTDILPGDYSLDCVSEFDADTLF